MKKKLTLLGFILTATQALATKNDELIWETSSRTLLKSIQGPVAMIIAIAAIVFCGFKWLTSDGREMGGGVKVVMVIGVIASATYLVTNVFGLDGGMIFG